MHAVSKGDGVRIFERYLVNRYLAPLARAVPRAAPANARHDDGPVLCAGLTLHPSAAVEQAAEKLNRVGARVVECDPPLHDLRTSFERLFFGESAKMAQRWDREQRRQLDPGHREVIEQHEGMTAIEYMQADRQRVDLMQRMSMFFRDYDMLLCPTVPILPFEAGREVPRDWPDRRWTSWALFTWPFNMTGQPALSVPCGRSEEGLSIGAQLVGDRHDDGRVLRAGLMLQQSIPAATQGAVR